MQFEVFAPNPFIETPRRMVGASVLAALAYAAAITALVVLSKPAAALIEEKLVEVTIKDPPPPKIETPAPVPRRAAEPSPVQSVRSAPALVTPVAVPDALPTAAAPTAGADFGTEMGAGIAEAAAPAPIALPEEADAPIADSANATPRYPEEARSAGREGTVILKVVVSESGTVESIDVMRGEEPFVSSAIAAVETWHFTPAKLSGKPIAVYRIIKVPFRLSE